MKCNICILLSLLCISLGACDKDEENTSGGFVIGDIELPALRNGANDIFLSPTPVGGIKLAHI